MLNNSAADQVHKPSDADWVCFRRGGGDSRVSRLVPMESGTALKAICMESLFITEIRAVGQ